MATIEESIGCGILDAYNKLLKKHPLYKEYQKATENWMNLRRKTKNICSICGKNGKTHLHHLDHSLRYDPRSILNIIYVPVKDILFCTPDEVIEKYLSKFKIRESIDYYSVKENEVIELCPKCHRKKHSKNE